MTSITEVPKQRNTREENQRIKDGEGDQLWDDHVPKKRHKDIHARWTKKHNKTYYGYKNHIKMDAKSKLIETYAVTDASVHDSQVLDQLLDKQQDAQQTLHADSAYTGAKQAKTIRQAGMKNRVHCKAQRNQPLTTRQKNANTKKSTTRARVEHVFGFMTTTMKGLKLRSAGIKRANAGIGLINLTYNLCRFEFLTRSAS